MLDPLVEFPRRKALEIRALAAIDVEDLDIVARLDMVGPRGGRLDAQIERGIGEGFGQVMQDGPGRISTPDRQDQRRQSLLPVRRHGGSGGGQQQMTRALDGKAGIGFGGGLRAKQP
jgi:hypothetical protein